MSRWTMLPPPRPAVDLTAIQTEDRNVNSINIDQVTTEELCRIINREDETIPGSIETCIGTIAQAVDALAERVRQGGRVFYIGAGTSGRLGVLDASEIPPTYSVPPSQFVGLIAGGDVALRNAVEGAEDSVMAAAADLEASEFDGGRDALIGIAASGRTPYVLGGLAHAKAKGCLTIGVACSAPSPMSTGGQVDFMVNAVTGAEVVTGSTRMKAGTATKLVLNMISTGIMIKVGKTYGNIMVDVKPTNVKLKHRARRILREICGEQCPSSDAALDDVLKSCGDSVKLAAVTLCLNISVEDAQRQLQQVNGVLSVALSNVGQDTRTTTLEQTMPIYLCVDAGGTKCAAVIKTANGIARGDSGPCNVSEIGVDVAVAQIRLAIQKAADSHPDGAVIAKLGFSDVLLGMAGIDRKGLKSRMHHALQDIIPVRSDGSFELMNDIALIAKAATPQDIGGHMIVLLAGTGSVAMTFEQRNGDIVVLDRSGGWGALLGDDGSGFDIGRKAIRFSLRNLERSKRMKTNRNSGDPEPGQFDVLTDAIIEHYSSGSNGPDFDLLSSILTPASFTTNSAVETKRRIASCAKLVIDSSKTSSAAARIVDTAQSSLVEMLEGLMLQSDVSSHNSILVLAGGIMQNEGFAEELKKLLEVGGLYFQCVVHAGKPAEMGVAHLARVNARDTKPRTRPSC